jgi:hypothetical protein
VKFSVALFSFLCLMFELPAFAQEIKLDNLAKIEFISSAPFWVGASLRVVEVLPEGNVWNSYQLRRYQERPKPIRDSVRHFAKAIPVKDLEQLLAYINKPDTALKIKQFNVSTEELKQHIDTLQTQAKKRFQFSHDKQDSVMCNLTTEQRACFLR